MYFVNFGLEVNELVMMMVRFYIGSFEMILLRNVYYGGSFNIIGLIVFNIWKYLLL